MLLWATVGCRRPPGWRCNCRVHWKRTIAGRALTQTHDTCALGHTMLELKSFTRVFGFDCGEGLIWGGGPLCFTGFLGFECGEGLICGEGPPSIPQNTNSERCFETCQNRSPEVILSTLGPICATRPFEGSFWDPICGGPPCFTRVFGFDCGEGLIWGGEPPCFTRVDRKSGG